VLIHAEYMSEIGELLPYTNDQQKTALQ